MSKNLANYLKKRKDGSTNGRAAVDEYLEGQCPLLHDMLTVTQLDGKPRRTSSLNIFAEDGRIKGSLQDRQECLVAFITFDSLEDVFHQLETALKEEKLEWRPMKRNRV